jgi:hypothetical protein
MEESFPFLKIGDINTVVQNVRNIPRLSDWLKIK